jgi:hypothetical protein
MPVLPAARIACRPNVLRTLTTRKMNGSGLPAQNAIGPASRCASAGFRLRHPRTTVHPRRGTASLRQFPFGDWKSPEIGADRSLITWINGIKNSSSYPLRNQVILPLQGDSRETKYKSRKEA